MEEKIVLQPFDRILSGYDKLEEVAVAISDCSVLCRKYRSYGVEGYRLGDFRGPSYLNRYLNCSVDQAPMLIYKGNILIPLVFRDSESSVRLFQDDFRMEGFFILLEWLLAIRPEEALINFNKYEIFDKRKEYVVDSAYVVFRLTEILDGAGFPLSHFEHLDAFIEWNRIYRLINNGQIGRHSKLFDEDDETNCSELKMILKIVTLKYPETKMII